MKIYSYGIIDSDNKVEKSIKGLESAFLYNISYRDISIVVSNLTEQIQNISPDRAVIHEIVIERLMAKFTVLPIRFLTVFDGKKKVLSVLKTYYSDFRENLDRLYNKVEFGIKVIWSADEIKKQIADTYVKNNHNMPMMGNSLGKSFVKKKFEAYKIDKEFNKEAEKHITEIDKFFSGFVTEKKLEKLRSEFLLLNASYLVRKEKQDEFRQAFEQLRNIQRDFKYLFSGPWPPYNFIVLKRKSIRQNVSEADMFNGIGLDQELASKGV